MGRKWEQAIYTAADGTVRSVQPEELHDTEFRAFLRTQELWDAEAENRLFIRYRPDAPHFYSPSEEVHPCIRQEETSELHKQRVDQILAAVQNQNLQFGHKTFDYDEPEFAVLFSSEPYHWEQEVTRTMSGIRWRHDLFGAHSAHRLSNRFPLVAIEVIDSHFPDARAFDAWLKLSAEMPCLVLFDFVQKKNYFFQVDAPMCRVRVIYYIFGGGVWRSGQRWTGCTANWFKEKVSAEIRGGKDN